MWADGEGIGGSGDSDDIIGAPIRARRREAWGQKRARCELAGAGHSFYRAEMARRCEVGVGFDRQ
jgi:hypothetical protein